MYFKFEHLDIITERKKGKKCFYIYIYIQHKKGKRIYRNLKREREREREKQERSPFNLHRKLTGNVNSIDN